MNSISISGWEGNDDVTGSAGVDTIYGSDGNDVLHGGVGVDSTIYPGTDRLFGENGDDTIYTDIDGAFAWGGNGNDVLLGGDGADEINGENGNDIPSGGKGDDGLNGGDGADIIRYADRGFGTDTIASFGAEDKMDLSALGIGSFEQLARYIEPYGDAYSSPDTNAQIELGYDGEAEAIHILGRPVSNLSAANFIFNTSTTPVVSQGTLGADVLFGGNGNDILTSLAGRDILDGGAGNDLYFVHDSSDLIVEQAGGGLDTAQAISSYTLPDNVEILKLLVDPDRYIQGHGNAADNIISAIFVSLFPPTVGPVELYGEGGNDQLIGTQWSDHLDGGTGNDIMEGGAYGDSYMVNSAGDMVIENIIGRIGGTDIVSASVSYTLSANVENLTLTESENIRGTGNALDNVIVGNEAYNVLSGLSGSDTLNGMGGADYLIPDRGNNIVDGGAGFDTLILLRAKATYSYLSDSDGWIYLVGEEGTTRMKGAVRRRHAGDRRAGDGPFRRLTGCAILRAMTT